DYSCFFFSSRRRHTRSDRDWSSDVCSSDLIALSINCPSWRYWIRLVGFWCHAAGTCTAAARILTIFCRFCRKSQVRLLQADFIRSEERRVGKEWRLQVLPDEWK